MPEMYVSYLLKTYHDISIFLNILPICVDFSSSSDVTPVTVDNFF